MTKQLIFSTALMIFGILSLLSACVIILGIILPYYGPYPMNRAQNQTVYYSMCAVLLLLNLAVAFIFLRHPDLVTKKVLGNNADSMTEDSMRLQTNAVQLAIRVSGVVVLTKGIYRLAEPVCLMVESMMRFPQFRTWRDWWSVLIALGYIAIAFYLIAGGKHIMRFAFRNRT